MSQGKPSDRIVIALGMSGVVLVTTIASLTSQRITAKRAAQSETERLVKADRDRELDEILERAKAREARDAQLDSRKKHALINPAAPSTSMLIFPTRQGLDAWLDALQTGDRIAAGVSAENSGAEVVEPRTPCQVTDAGVVVTQVRILSGPETGMRGFVPTEWVQLPKTSLTGSRCLAARSRKPSPASQSRTCATLRHELALLLPQ